MSRDVSAAFYAAVNAQETEEVFLILLTIDHDDLNEPLRVVCNNEDVTSNGKVYVGYPFQIKLPDDMDEGPPRAQITIDNVDQTIVRTLRSILTSPNVTIEIALASDPDTIEADFPDFLLTDIQYNVQTVTGNLALEQYVQEPYPSDNFTPSTCPGLF